MLTLTPAAEAAITTLMDNPEIPGDASLRLQRGVDSSGAATIGISIVSAPEPDDETVPAGPSNDVLVAPDVAGMLDDQVLDAEIEGEQVAFTLRPQGIDGRPPEAPA